MSMEHSTALALRISVVVGIAVMAAGLAMSMAGMGDAVLYAGMLVLIASPLVGVVVTLAALMRMKDWYWAAIAALLLTITAVGAAIATLRRCRRWNRMRESSEKGCPDASGMNG